MEPSYNQMGQPESSSPRPNFASYSPHLSMNMGMGQMIHLQQPSYFSQMGQPEPEFHHQGSAVKNEGSAGKRPRFQNYPFAVREALSNDCDLGVAVGGNRGNNANTTDTTDNSHGNNNCSSVGCSEVEAMKAKIIAHPHYSNLLQAYTDCQKVGAPPDVVSRLSAMMNEFETKQRSFVGFRDTSNDPELDQFMEAYCDMLVKYREELTRPVEEAMEFMRRIESQLNILTNGRALLINSDERCEGSSEEEPENSGGEMEVSEMDPRAEDRELKNHLLKKYSGYLSSLKQELSKKKKKGKLPKEARQKLLTWWELHYKWPYPSESEKVGLAEATGLDQKQINNWFINQRKRHWKPSEDMQFMVMDGLHPAHNAAALYMEGHYLPDAPYRFGT